MVDTVVVSASWSKSICSCRTVIVLFRQYNFWSFIRNELSFDILVYYFSVNKKYSIWMELVHEHMQIIKS